MSDTARSGPVRSTQPVRDATAGNRLGRGMSHEENHSVGGEKSGAASLDTAPPGSARERAIGPGPAIAPVRRPWPRGLPAGGRKPADLASISQPWQQVPELSAASRARRRGGSADTTFAQLADHKESKRWQQNPEVCAHIGSLPPFGAKMGGGWQEDPDVSAHIGHPPPPVTGGRSSRPIYLRRCRVRYPSHRDARRKGAHIGLLLSRFSF